MNESALNVRLASNWSAVSVLTSKAASIGVLRWSIPLAAGKWTPAQHVSHVVLAYAATTADIRDGCRAHLIGSARQRFAWRLFGLTQVTLLGRIPPGARTPRELDPSGESPDREPLLAALRSQVEEFDAAVRQRWRTVPGHRVTHPYFGALSLAQAIRVCEVHSRHHAGLLPSA